MVEFESPAELRRNQLEKLVAGFRLFSYFGYDEGVAGHITFRDPEFNDHFWVNPLGVHFSQIKISDLLLVNHDGEVVQGNSQSMSRPLQYIQDFIKPDLMLMLQLIHIQCMEEPSHLLASYLIQSLKILVLFMKDKQCMIIFLVW